MRWNDRLRTEARDLLELVLVPGLAAFLPWRLCFRLFRFACRFDFLYRDAVQRAFEQAEARGWITCEPQRWRQFRRLVMLVDQADFYLAVTRSDRWIARHVETTGTWPAPDSGPGLLCTFHWGAGMWALRSAGAHGLRAHALVAAHVRSNFPGRSVAFWYYGLRNRAVRAALRRDPIEVSPQPRRVLQALSEREQVLALVDVPPDRVAATCPVELLGHRVQMPRGLLRIAAKQRVPVTIYLNGIRYSDGKRTLELRQLGAYDDADALMRDVFRILDETLRRDPIGWHFWPIAQVFFGDATSTD